MLTIRNAEKPGHRGRIGLAMAGGGPLGAIYELGALLALEDSIEGLDLTDLDVYVGVSSGSFLAAGLANRMSLTRMCRIFISSRAIEQPFSPEMFLRPAWREYFGRARKVPSLITGSIMSIIRHPLDRNLTGILGSLGAAIPTGIFDNDSIAEFLQKIFTRSGRTNDFRQLRNPLYVVAVELDSGSAVRFGAEGLDHVPISKAVEASAALPGLFPPVKIGDKHYLDGALRRTLHASVALGHDIDLLLAVNPIVPFDADRAKTGTRRSLVDGGLPLVLSQTFRALIQSRMQIGLAKYGAQYPHTDLVLVEPDRDDEEMFFSNVFSYASRKELCQHSFYKTREDLREQRESLGPALERQGLSLREDRLDDPERHFRDSLQPLPDFLHPVTDGLRITLDELERAIL